MSINFLVNQPTNGIFGQDFPIMCKLNDRGHSFFASIGFGLLCQISRLQNTAHANDCIQQLNQLIAEGIQIVGNQGFYFEKIEQFRNLCNYSKNTNISSYLPWLGQNGGESVAFSIRIITFSILNKINHPESEIIRDMASPPRDDIAVLEALSQSLILSFYFYDGSVPKIIDKSQAGVKPILFIGKLSVGEYASLSHKMFENESDYYKLFNDYPFIQTGQMASNLGGIVKNVLPSQQNLPKIASAYSELIKFIMEFVIVRDWKFSNQEKQELMPVLKQLKADDLYKDEALKLYSIMKKCNCNHNHKCFFKFQCEKYHCIDCLREEIQLKKLMNYQVFCTCKIPLKESEINYFFSDEMKLNMKNFSGGQNPTVNSPSIDSGLPNGLQPGFALAPQIGFPVKPPAMPTGLSTGMPTGTPQGMPTGLPPGMPSGMPPGMPPGMPTGMPTGIPGLPKAMPTGMPGLPTGMHTGTPTGIPTGMPTGMQGMPTGMQGMPTGMSAGMPTGIPTGTQMGYPPSISGMPSIPTAIPQKPAGFPSFPDNSSLQGVISLPRASFCAKCGVPISPSEVDSRGGKLYHKSCKD